MRRLGDFDGYPLAAGSVHGVRQWSVDSLGRLRGLHYPAVWKPGENIATSGPCGVSARCGCGFWAYYDDATWNNYSIRGVIEGYGKTTLGTKGFRCEKARVLALCIPGGGRHRVGNVWDRYCLWAHAHAFPAICSAVFGFFGGCMLMALGTLWWVLGGSALMLAMVGGAVTTLRAAFRGIDLYYDRKAGAERHPQVDVDQVRRNYPDVEIFSDYKAMLAAFPLTKAEEPTPEDAEFWELEATNPMPPLHLWKPKGGAR